MKLDDLDESDFGCVIDCSHDKAIELDRRIIEYARSFGFVLDDDAQQVLQDLERIDSLPLDQAADLSQDLYDISREAVDYLNSNSPSRIYFVIDDNSLYLDGFGD